MNTLRARRLLDRMDMAPSTFEGNVTFYRELGYEIDTVKGASPHSDDMVCIPHDGVPYCVSHYGKKSSAVHALSHLELIKARHHTEVKGVYEHLLTKDAGDIWVMCGGGCNIQAFFGNKTGYLGILYLSMDNTPMGKLYAEDQPKTQVWTLTGNWTKNDRYFKGMKVPNVKFQKSAG